MSDRCFISFSALITRNKTERRVLIGNEVQYCVKHFCIGSFVRYALLAVARAKHKFFEVQNKTGISVSSLFAHVSCCLYWIQFCLQPIENMSSSFISILRETWNIADILFNSIK